MRSFVTGFNNHLSKCRVVGLILCICLHYVILLPTSSALPQPQLDVVVDENSTTVLPDYPDPADDNSLVQSHSNFGFGVGNSGSNGTLEDRERLIKHLLDKYNKLNYPSNITVQLGASILTLNIDGLPRRNTFETNILVRKLWTDSRLEWNPSNYGGLDVISLPSSTVWTPQIRLLNSVSFPSSKHCEESNVLIDSDGHVLLATPCQYTAFCNVSLEDEGPQSCQLVFGAYSWGGSFMDLQVYKKDGLPRRNTFETNILVRKLWTDSRLEWNPSNYGGLDVISLPSSTVWTPQIRLLNSVSFPSSKHCEESNVLIDSDGHVLLATPCQYTAFCNVSLEDEGPQSCQLVFGAYSWGGSFMDLQVYKKQQGVDSTFFNDVTDVAVTGSKSHRLEKHYGFYSETFPVVLKFELMFHRKPHVGNQNQDDAYSSADLSTPSGNFSSFATYSISNTAPVTACADSHRVGPDGTCVPVTDFA